MREPLAGRVPGAEPGLLPVAAREPEQVLVPGDVPGPEYLLLGGLERAGSELVRSELVRSELARSEPRYSLRACSARVRCRLIHPEHLERLPARWPRQLPLPQRWLEPLQGGPPRASFPVRRCERIQVASSCSSGRQAGRPGSTVARVPPILPFPAQHWLLQLVLAGPLLSLLLHPRLSATLLPQL